jgi:hypothetical protein
MERTEVRAMGMTVFARINRAAAATSAGLALRPPAVEPMILDPFNCALNTAVSAKIALKSNARIQVLAL